MKINNEFTVSVPAEEAWNTMLDLERVAPCLPGAAIQEDKGDGEYEGTVKVKEADEENHRAVLKATGRDARGQGTASATIVSTLQEEGHDTKVSVETDMKLTGRAAQFGRGIAQDVATKMLAQFANCLEREISGGPEEGAAAASEAPTETSGNGASSQDTASAAPADGVGGTAGRVISSEDPSVIPEGSVEGAVVSEGASEAAGQPRREPEEAEAFDLGAASQEAIVKRAVPVLVGLGLLAFLIWLIRR